MRKEKKMSILIHHFKRILTTNHFLYLSGTPFRALQTGEFIEEQIFNWTYGDEQREKLNWIGKDNPYLTMPKMAMLCVGIF
mgnify:CR=1 FL=1